MANLDENKPTNQDITDELVKKSKELREKHRKSNEVFEDLKERTEKFLSSDKDKDINPLPDH